MTNTDTDTSSFEQLDSEILRLEAELAKQQDENKKKQETVQGLKETNLSLKAEKEQTKENLSVLKLAEKDLRGNIEKYKGEIDKKSSAIQLVYQAASNFITGDDASNLQSPDISPVKSGNIRLITGSSSSTFEQAQRLDFDNNSAHSEATGYTI